MDTLIAFVQNHPGWSGLIGGILIGFFPSVYAGHLANLFTEKRAKKKAAAKQKKFIYELEVSTCKLVTSIDIDEAEVDRRRAFVESKVKELSQKIYKEDYPRIATIRDESTQYPKLPCKWCHRGHQAFAGSLGKCTNCSLPLDLWIGIQGEPQKP